jgi:acyl carrier protein
MDKEELKKKLKEQIVQYLNLLEIKPEDIGDKDPFFGGPLGLDSIDALELIVLLEREYGIKLQSTAEGRKVLIDIDTMADYIIANTTQKTE